MFPSLWWKQRIFTLGESHILAFELAFPGVDISSLSMKARNFFPVKVPYLGFLGFPEVAISSISMKARNFCMTVKQSFLVFLAFLAVGSVTKFHTFRKNQEEPLNFPGFSWVTCPGFAKKARNFFAFLAFPGFLEAKKHGKARSSRLFLAFHAFPEYFLQRSFCGTGRYHILLHCI